MITFHECDSHTADVNLFSFRKGSLSLQKLPNPEEGGKVYGRTFEGLSA